MNLATVPTFPASEREFLERFSSEEACRDLLASLRWQGGFVCPACGHREAWRRRNREEWICASPSCGKETSVRTGTVLHGSRKPLRDWVFAMYYVVSSKQGISALELQRRLRLGSYETALRWLREIRRAIGDVLASRAKLAGEVEFDEMHIGQSNETGKPGMASTKKVAVLGAVERFHGGCGRARMRVINKRDRASVIKFVTGTIEKGSLIAADTGSIFRTVGRHGFQTDFRVMSKKGVRLKTEDGESPSAAHLPRVHRVFSLFKRLILGTHQGNYSREHLQGYLDEYCFRFERRKERSCATLFGEVAVAAVSRQCVPLWRSRGRTSPKKPVVPYNRNAGLRQRFAELLTGGRHGNS